MKLLHRRVLLVLCVGVCALVFPAVAAASISPSLTLNEAATPTAGTTNYSLGFDLKFNPSDTTDNPKNVKQIFPSGLLADSTLVNPGSGTLCILTPASNANAENSACRVANGSATLTGVGSAPAAEYLVQAPHSGDVAGTLLDIGGNKVSVADVTVRSSDSGLDVAFTNLPPVSLPTSPQVTELNLTLTDLRLPSSCTTNNMTVQAVSQEDTTVQSVSKPLTVTGCPTAQNYAPQLSGQIRNFASGAEVITTVTQQANEAASRSQELDLPSNLHTNTLALTPCLSGPCQIGTASALTPLAPPQALAHGIVTLDASNPSAPIMTISFPAPYALSIVGTVDQAKNTVTFPNVPDVPITKLVLDITGTSQGKAFTTDCKPSNVIAKLTGQGGQSKTDTVPLQYLSGCSTPPPAAGKPTSSGSESGLASGKPVVTLHVKHGSNAPKLRSVTIGLGSGLRFNSKAFHKGKHMPKGLSVSGASVKSVKLSGGKLSITFSSPASGATITMRGPLLVESKSLQKQAQKHKSKHVPVTVKLTDTSGKSTTNRF